jgi:DNA-nicking Smr family endonuclease
MRRTRLPRVLTDNDHANWANYARLVRPLPGRAVPLPPAQAENPPSPAPSPLPAAARPHVALAARAQPPVVATGVHPPGLDAASWQRFSHGKMLPTRTLDLHGKTAQAAFHALERFLHTARADHVRCVEVITGRGSGETGGVIRRELPLWLNLPSIRPMILAAAHPGGAAFRAPNDGATRLLLRRARN